MPGVVKKELSAASFGKIPHSRGSHVHHNIHPLPLNILAATLEVIIRIFASFQQIQNSNYLT